VKLTPAGVNFINVLRAAFTLADPKSAKKTVKSSSFLALSGSASVKAARRALVKLTPANCTHQSQYYLEENVGSVTKARRNVEHCC